MFFICSYRCLDDLTKKTRSVFRKCVKSVFHCVFDDCLCVCECVGVCLCVTVSVSKFLCLLLGYTIRGGARFVQHG